MPTMTAKSRRNLRTVFLSGLVACAAAFAALWLFDRGSLSGSAVLDVVTVTYAGMMLGVLYLIWTKRQHVARVRDALDNMAEGLCMFGPDTRLLVCNGKYLQMYNLSPDVVKPGITLRALLQYRKTQGAFDADPEQYCNKLVETIRRGEMATAEVQTSGRTIVVINRPMPDGRWVATH
jgi:PAS domain-containing protein